MPLINCKINLIITWSNRCFIIDNPIAGQGPTFASTNTKFYLVVVTLSIQDNEKLLEQLKSGFKRTINWKKYEPKVRVEQWNRYLKSLINSSFQGVNRLFALSFENTGGRTSDTFSIKQVPLVEKKNYNAVIGERKIFDQPVTNNFITYDDIRKTQLVVY